MVLFFLSCSYASVSRREESSIVGASSSVSYRGSDVVASQLALLFTKSLVRRRTRVGTTHASAKCSCSSYFGFIGRRVGQTSVTVTGLRMALNKGPCHNCPTFDTPSRCLFTVHSTNFSILVATGGRYLSGNGGKLREALLVLSSLRVPRTKACIGARSQRRRCPLLLRGGNFHVTLLGCACNAGNVGMVSPGIMGCVSGTMVTRSVRTTETRRPSTLVTYVR